MGMSFLEFRGAKQFFRRTAFFVVLGSLWQWFLRGFTGCRAQLPLPAKIISQTKVGWRKENPAADRAVRKQQWLPGFPPCSTGIY
ncbi:hypothetical protein DTW91_11320 [Chryseobacterium sp. SC28]|nr:hypothetical protein DTW91_11320 [Chryseobacterium sp. SC28]